MSSNRKRSRDSVQSMDAYNPYGYDPQLPLLRGDPRLNPGLGLGVNWHPSQPVTNEWADWSGAHRPIFDMGKARLLPHAPPPPGPAVGQGPGVRSIAPNAAGAVDVDGSRRFEREAESHHQRRLSRNRHAAKLARRRKQQYLDSLHDQVRSLEASLAALRDHVWGTPSDRGRVPAAASAVGEAHRSQAHLVGPRGPEVNYQLAHMLEVCTPSGATRLRGVAGSLLAADLAEPASALVQRFSHSMTAYAQAAAAPRDDALDNGLLLCCAKTPTNEEVAGGVPNPCPVGARRRAACQDGASVLGLSREQRRSVAGLKRALVQERARMGDCMLTLRRINAAIKPALGPFASARSALSSVLTSQQLGKLASMLLRDTPLSRTLQQSRTAVDAQMPESLAPPPPPAPAEKPGPSRSVSSAGAATTGPDNTDTAAATAAAAAASAAATASRGRRRSSRVHAAASAPEAASGAASNGAASSASGATSSSQSLEGMSAEALRAREAELEAQVQGLLGELARVRGARYGSGTHMVPHRNPGWVVDELERAHAGTPSWAGADVGPAQGPPPAQDAETALGPWAPEMNELGVDLRELLSE